MVDSQINLGAGQRVGDPPPRARIPRPGPVQSASLSQGRSGGEAVPRGEGLHDVRMGAEGVLWTGARGAGDVVDGGAFGVGVQDCARGGCEWAAGAGGYLRLHVSFFCNAE